jgi:hypothetical protein
MKDDFEEYLGVWGRGVAHPLLGPVLMCSIYPQWAPSFGKPTETTSFMSAQKNGKFGTVCRQNR